MEKSFFTLKELAQYIGVSESVVRKWIKTSAVPGATKIGFGRGTWKFDRKVIDRHIQNGSFRFDSK